jgi:phospholipase C
MFSDLDARRLVGAPHRAVERQVALDDRTITVPAGRDRVRRVELERSAHWYDFTVLVRGLPGFRRRFAGRVETGRDSLSDPALGGPALGDQP